LGKTLNSAALYSSPHVFGKFLCIRLTVVAFLTNKNQVLSV